MDLNIKDPVTGENWRDYLIRNGMSIENAKECFDRVAYIQSPLNLQSSGNPSPRLQGSRSKLGEPFSRL